MSEPWITMSDADVFPANSGERIAIATAKGADDLDQVVQDVIETFRQVISGRGNALGAEGTIPAGFKRYAVSLALWHFLEGVARNDGIHTKERETAANRAEDLLQSIREGNTAVPSPTGTTPGVGRGGSWNSENKIEGRTHPVPRPPSPGDEDYANS